MELLRNQKVDFPVMLLQGSETVRIPTNKKSRPQGIVACRNGSDIRNTTATPLPYRCCFLLRFQRMISKLGAGEQAGGQVHADSDGHKKIRQQHREESSGDFEDTASTAPADTLRVVKDRPSFFHGSV